jgi:hypothetical protein
LERREEDDGIEESLSCWWLCKSSFLSLLSFLYLARRSWRQICLPIGLGSPDGLFYWKWVILLEMLN